MLDFKFDWLPSLETGNLMIDTQHKELFRIAREIEQVILTNCIGVDDSYLLNLLCHVRDYVTYHFYFEEELLKTMSSPNFDKQTRAHQAFIAKINAIDCIHLCKNPKEGLTILKDLIQDLFFEHIIIEDIKDFKL